MGALKYEYLPHYTYDDYKLWEGRWELIDGIAYAMSPSPVSIHQEISGNIHIELIVKLKNCKNCKAKLALDWIISNDAVVCPDNSVVCDEINSDYIKTPPKIIFEVLSPSTEKKDRFIKYEIYKEQGVKYYVLADPKKGFAEVYKIENGSYRFEGKFKDKAYRFYIDSCEIEFNFGNIFKD